MINKNKEILIVPDVHGRSFWVEHVNKYLIETDCKIIFLGDYLDPYYDDFFNEKDEPIFTNLKTMTEVQENNIKMLLDIIELKKKYTERIILLLGNHDCGYIYGENFCNCRTDKFNKIKIKNIFHENINIFQLAHEEYINDKHFIFTHAGINKKYAYDCFGDEVNEDNVVTLFNNAFKNNNYGVIDSLTLYSHYRGGWRSNYGSLIWADVREWYDDGNEPYGYPIIGHTQLSSYLIKDNLACLDSRECFIINKQGEIKKL